MNRGRGQRRQFTITFDCTTHRNIPSDPCSQQLSFCEPNYLISFDHSIDKIRSHPLYLHIPVPHWPSFPLMPICRLNLERRQLTKTARSRWSMSPHPLSRGNLRQHNQIYGGLWLALDIFVSLFHCNQFSHVQIKGVLKFRGKWWLFKDYPNQTNKCIHNTRTTTPRRYSARLLVVIVRREVITNAPGRTTSGPKCSIGVVGMTVSSVTSVTRESGRTPPKGINV